MNNNHSIILTGEFIRRQKEPLVYKKVQGKHKTWLYPINCPNPGDHIYCSASPRENEPGYQGFRGFGGSTLSFQLKNGSVEKMQGPWYSDSNALKDDTGMDLTHHHLTYVIVAEKRTYENYSTVLHGILYQDDKPMVGEFGRGKAIGQMYAKKLGCKVVVYSETFGGSSCSPVQQELI